MAARRRTKEEALEAIQSYMTPDRIRAFHLINEAEIRPILPQNALKRCDKIISDTMKLFLTQIHLPIEGDEDMRSLVERKDIVTLLRILREAANSVPPDRSDAYYNMVCTIVESWNMNSLGEQLQMLLEHYQFERMRQVNQVNQVNVQRQEANPQNTNWQNNGTYAPATGNNIVQGTGNSLMATLTGDVKPQTFQVILLVVGITAAVAALLWGSSKGSRNLFGSIWGNK